MDERVLFKPKKQKAFFNVVKERLRVRSLRLILQVGFEVPYSTLKGYYNERMLLPKTFFDNLCHVAKISPLDFNVKYLPGNWGHSLGGKEAMKVLKKKYPLELIKWRSLGRARSPIFGKDSNIKSIKMPVLDEKLAEFIGAYLGDGTLTPYFIRISGDSRFDVSYYSYLSKLVMDLFGLTAVIRKEKSNNTLHFIIYSKNLCSYLNKEFGLNYGDKIRNKTCIPSNILKSKKLSLACLRGLIDTDGCISRRGRNGEQFCIQFSSHSPCLLNQVKNITKTSNLFTFSEERGAGTNKWENILKYFKLVGSSNLKHIIRFDLRNKGINVYRKDIMGYFEKDLYKNMALPFKTF
jgi:hypothetical protein